VPETGICLEILCHLAINRLGKVSICERFDPKAFGIIGDANHQPLEGIWPEEKRVGTESY